MKHEPVMIREAIGSLRIDPKGIYVDATLGGAGHSRAILDHLDGGLLIAFEQDDFAIDYARNILKDHGDYVIIKSNFRYMKKELEARGIERIDGVLFDLGMSSFQIDDRGRGFSYLTDAPLDMRMDRDQEVTAGHILNTYELDELARIIYLYGEEKKSYPIARKIIEKRPLTTTGELVAITDRFNPKSKGHSAKRVFQALRIAVNDELAALSEALTSSVDLLKPGGRIVVITFHSLEDRIVKHYFKRMSSSDMPAGIPVMDEKEPILRTVTKKPIYPSEAEKSVNPRSHSAKLRAAERTSS
ncbi:MAG: 16S rRNA (cytosine(1402)-N(4))-methyltransferase RsmH [Acholeplasmataceae bacterium]